MRSSDVRTLYDFNDWANRALLRETAAVPADLLAAPGTFTYRGLRGTLVHILDVEWSWRRLLRSRRHDPDEVSLTEALLPTIDAITERWNSIDAETRAWLDELTDVDVAQIVDLGDGDSFPLWYYLVHVVTHSEQQRRDVQLLLRSFGVEPPELEFLWYADHLAGKGDRRPG